MVGQHLIPTGGPSPTTTAATTTTTSTTTTTTNTINPRLGHQGAPKDSHQQYPPPAIPSRLKPALQGSTGNPSGPSTLKSRLDSYGGLARAQARVPGAPGRGPAALAGAPVASPRGATGPVVGPGCPAVVAGPAAGAVEDRGGSPIGGSASPYRGPSQPLSGMAPLSTDLLTESSDGRWEREPDPWQELLSGPIRLQGGGQSAGTG